MRTWLIVALLAAVALSGCASDVGTVDVQGADTSTSDTDGNTTADPSTPSGNATGEAGGNGTGDVENQVPVLTVTADVVNGTAPLLVNFTLSVEDDSESISWAFLIDGDETLTGTDVPAAFNHTFDVGSWNVTFEATDGSHAVNEIFVIEVVEGFPAGPEIFYLHSENRRGGTMDHMPAAGQEGGHGLVGADTPPYQGTYTATEPTFKPHAAGTAIEAHVQAFGVAPSPMTSMTGTLFADGVEVGSATSDAQNVVSLALVTTPCTDWTITFDLTGDIPLGSTLSFEVEGDNVMRLAPCYPGGEDGPRVMLGE